MKWSGIPIEHFRPGQGSNADLRTDKDLRGWVGQGWVKVMVRIRTRVGL